MKDFKPGQPVYYVDKQYGLIMEGKFDSHSDNTNVINVVMDEHDPWLDFMDIDRLPENERKKVMTFELHRNECFETRQEAESHRDRRINSEAKALSEQIKTVENLMDCMCSLMKHYVPVKVAKMKTKELLGIKLD